jgi:carboxylesterase type B
MIFGSNSDEGNVFTLGTYLSPIVSAANYSSFLSENFGPAASIVEKQYPLTLPAFNSSGILGFEAISTIITQAQFHCPVYQALLKAQSNNIPVYTYLNSHTPSCPWTTALSAAVLPLVGATHTSEIQYVFGNGVDLPLPSGNCSFNAQERAISEDLIAAWSAMASTGNPSVQGGLQWPQWTNDTSEGVNIADAVTVGAVDFSQCAFWNMIDTVYLNLTSSSVNETSGNSSTGNVGGKTNGAERGVEIGVWGLTLAVGITVSVLMG